MKKLGVFLVVAALLVGCSYYRVVDPASGKEYFTTKAKERKSGAVTIKDAKTGAKVTLQSSEVHKISKKEFKEGLQDRAEGDAPVKEAPKEAEEGA